MPSLNMLSKPLMSTGRKVGLAALRSYLAIAMILVSSRSFRWPSDTKAGTRLRPKETA